MLGDLLSSAGRVVRRNNDLTRNLGLMPIAPDVGLDAVDIIAGGEILFSINQDVFSETLGHCSTVICYPIAGEL